MSRSGYSDSCDGWALIRWRGAVASAIRGKRGQAMLQELAQALDALPEKTLAAESLVTTDGAYCTLGALGRSRGLDMAPIDPEDRDAVAAAFGLPIALAAEIMYLNDDYSADDWMFVDVEFCGPVRPGYPDWGRHTRTIRVQNPRAGEERWSYMRNWVRANIKGQPAALEAGTTKGKK